jgi:hypothetical protein
MKLLPPPGPERWRAIGLLFAILVLAAYFIPGVFSTDTPPPSVVRGANPAGGTLPASGQTARGAASQTKKGDQDSPVTVNLAALEPAVESAAPASDRNPFRFGEPPKPPPPPFVPPPQLPPPPPFVPPPPPAPQVELKLLGTIFVPGEGFRAALKDNKRDVQFTGVEGDVIDGRYKLIKVADKSAVVSFLDGTGQRTLRVGAG